MAGCVSVWALSSWPSRRSRAARRWHPRMIPCGWGARRAAEAVDLTAGTPVLVLDGMSGLPTAGVVFAGRRLVDLLAHTAVNADGLSALAARCTPGNRGPWRRT